MKRNIIRAVTLLLAIAAVFALTVPALAGAPNAAEPQDCSHSNWERVGTTIMYTDCGDGTQHYKGHILYYKCKDCEYIDAKVDLTAYGKQPHTFGGYKYYSSNHTGNYLKHTYTYLRSCIGCDRRETKIEWANCTKDVCIDPQSILPDIM